MGEAFLDYKKGGSGGLDINGIIEDYYVYAGENVNAGDFVEFINGIAGSASEAGVDTQLCTDTNTAYIGRISAVELTDGNVFIAHSYGTSYYLYGVVAKIEGATITVGTDTVIYQRSYAGSYISAVALENNRVFIARSQDVNLYLYGSLCSVNGTTITVDASKELNGGSKAGNAVSATPLTNGDIFVAHSYGTSYYLYGMVVTIDGNTITAGTDKLITDSNGKAYAGARISAKTFPNGKVFVAHSYTDTYNVAGCICSVSGTTITMENNVILADGTQDLAVTLSLAILSDNKVFIAHTYGTKTYLAGLVCTISGSTISAGTDYTNLVGTQYAGSALSAIPFSETQVCIVHSYWTSYKLNATYVTIDGTTVTRIGYPTLESESYSGRTISAIPLESGNVFIAHSHTDAYYLYGRLWGVTSDKKLTSNVTTATYETQVKKATTLPCNGVASTSGEGGDETGHKDVVSVFLPLSFYNQFNLITNGDFSNGLEGWTLTSSAFSQLTSETGGYEGNCAKVTITNPPTYASSCNLENVEFNLYANHVYYISFLYKGFKNNVANMNAGISLFNSSLKAFVTSTSNFTEGGDLITWQKRSAYGTNSEDGKGYVTLYTSIQNHDITITEGMAICYDNIRCYDLTAIFGVGNEPTQEWCDANL